MLILSFLLPLLSLVLINPLGASRGWIWTEPKVWAVAVWVAFTWLSLLYPLLKQQVNLAPLKRFALLYGFFLLAGLLSVWLSPFPLRAFLGQSTMGDGWNYWLAVGALALGNSLLLAIRPKLFRAQLLGVVAGGVVMAIAVLPQMFNWTLDYTATMGQTFPGNEPLLSTIFRGQMPIGLTSHRGHAGLVLACVSVLLVAARLTGFLRPKIALPLLFIAGLALWCTYTRGPYLAFFAGLTPLVFLHRSWRAWGQVAWVILASYGAFLGLGHFAELNRDFQPPGLNESFASGRLRLWSLAWEGIKARPLVGWGFDGFGLAFPFVADFTHLEAGYLKNVSKPTHITEVSDYAFEYKDINDQTHTGVLATNKAHNLLLDGLLSVGVLGFVPYLLAFGALLQLTLRGPAAALGAVGIAYLVYTLTWFESAQFSHLAWWALSAGAGLALAQKVGGDHVPQGLQPNRATRRHQHHLDPSGSPHP